MNETLDIKFFETLYNRKKIQFTLLAKDISTIFKYEDYEIIVVGFFPDKKVPKKIPFEDLLSIFTFINIIDKTSGRFLKIHREKNVETKI